MYVITMSKLQNTPDSTQNKNFLLLFLINILALIQQAMHMQKLFHSHLLKIFNPLKIFNIKRFRKVGQNKPR